MSDLDIVERLRAQLAARDALLDRQALRLKEVQNQLASAEMAIRNQDGMEYFGRRFDRAMDRAARAEAQLASAEERSSSFFDELGVQATKNMELTAQLASARKAFTSIRDFSDSEMRDGDAARELAKQWLADDTGKSP